MLNRDMLYLEGADYFTDQQQYLRNRLGARDYYMQSLLFCIFVKKYPAKHTMKLLYIKHPNTYYGHKKQAEKLRGAYFLKKLY